MPKIHGDGRISDRVEIESPRSETGLTSERERWAEETSQTFADLALQLGGEPFVHPPVLSKDLADPEPEPEPEPEWDPDTPPQRPSTQDRRDVWERYARYLGLSDDEIDGMTKAQLIERLGSK